MSTLITVFLGSPGDVEYARGIARKVFNSLNKELIGSNIFFRCMDYRDLPSQMGNPQHDVVNGFIAKTGLVILFFSKKAGHGTLEEYRYSFELYRNDRLYDLMVYFESCDNNEALHSFKDAIKENILFQEFTAEKLYRQLLNHLRIWSGRKNRLFEILHSTNADNHLLATMQVQDPVYNDQLIDLSKLPDKETDKLGNKFLNEYLTTTDVFTGLTEARCYLIAKTLYKKILANDYETFKHRQFINSIHQHLSKHIRHSNDKQKIVTILSNWMSASDRMYNNVRNFAAFELGMIKAEEAIPALLQAAKNQKELIEVRYYAVMALGMIRNKIITNELLDHYSTEKDPKIQALLLNVFHHLYK